MRVGLTFLHNQHHKGRKREVFIECNLAIFRCSKSINPCSMITLNNGRCQEIRAKKEEELAIQNDVVICEQIIICIDYTRFF